MFSISMGGKRNELIINYLSKVKVANKELSKKEAFKDLLNRLYTGNAEIERIIDKISIGSETTVVNIPRKNKVHKGRADTLYNNIIIEFENNLKNSEKHAKEQLSGYLLGQFRSGGGYNYTLIATDCITWKVFSPDISQLEELGTVNEEELILNEVASSSFVLNEQNANDFYFWIDRFLFKEQKQKATLLKIEESFGHQSNVFIESFLELQKHYTEAKKYGEVQVSNEQWKKFLSIAYGSFDASESKFLIHTYLSVFAKMLAYAVVSNNDYICDTEMMDIIKGDIFVSHNIRNFVENDFFHWVGSERSFRKLKKTFRLIAQEISTYDFQQVDEDILKGVYQELIDLDTRHALGEYYTPDWLCERIVGEFEFKASSKILDPACGSGSFLRAAIGRIRENKPDISVEMLNDNVYGIDIHPLSVQIAKTTVLIALGKDVSKLKRPIQLNIILANALLAPEGVNNLFGNDFTLNIDKKTLVLSTQILDDDKLFNLGIDICNNLASDTMSRKAETEETLINIIKYQTGNKGLNGNISDNFHKIYLALKEVKEKGRNSIWSFIIKNLYKPYFLNKRFDYVIGNPPWFTYSSIKNSEYQNQLGVLAEQYSIKPERVANFPHLEIAAIFLAYCSSYYLRENGKLAFVLPRSFFSADHHENTRSGKAKGFRLINVWDLKDVSPLFRIPSCVFFAEKTQGKRALPAKGIKGTAFSGKLPAHNCNLPEAIPSISETETDWFLVKQGSSSAFSNQKRKTVNKINPYKKLFKQGATIVPRSFYFVQLNQTMPPDWDDRIISIITSDSIQADAKAPWKGIAFSGQIESQFLYRTAISKSILPFALYNPDIIILPALVETKKNKKEIHLHTPKELLRMGYRNTAKWFENAENVWKIHCTEKNKKHTSIDYLNWQNKLTSQNLSTKYLVLYNASAKDANATIVERAEQDLEFIVESKTYVYYTNNLNEAYYLTAFLNADTPNIMIKDFQTHGLFGARDVHKKILDVYFPAFDEGNKTHFLLSELSIQAHKKVSTFLQSLKNNSNDSAHSLGKLRLEIKRHLEKEMKEMDKLVRKIMR